LKKGFEYAENNHFSLNIPVRMKMNICQESL
jgi:hypothetical protein